VDVEGEGGAVKKWKSVPTISDRHCEPGSCVSGEGSKWHILCLAKH